MQKPTLQLNFAGSRTKDPRITHNRASAAYEIAPDGLLRKVPADTMRFMHDLTTGKSLGYLPEEARTNGIQQPNDFTHANWVKTAGGTASVPKVYPYAGEAPDGSWSATRVDFALNGGTTSTDNSNLWYNFATVTGQPTCAAIWIKTIDGSTKTFRFDFQGVTADSAPYNNSTITVTGEWQRFVIALDSAVDTLRRIYLRLRGTLGTSDSASVLVWGGYQQNNVTSPTSDVPDATAFVSRASTKTVVGADGNLATIGIDEAPWSYNPLRLSAPPALMYEVSRTNLLPYSEQFDNAGWTKARSSITANAVVAPDGTLTADKLVEDTSVTASHYIRYNISLSANTTYTASVYVKAAERTSFQIMLFDSSGWSNTSSANVDLITGTLTLSGTGATGGVQQLDNGWYRVYLTQTTDGTTGTKSIGGYIVSGLSTIYTGDGTSGLYIWGAQLEAGDYPSSYIPTTTTTVTRAADVVTYSAATRAADVAYIDGQNFLDFYNQSEGTLVIEGEHVAPSAGVTDVLVDIGFGGVFGTSLYAYRTSDGYAVGPTTAPISVLLDLGQPAGSKYRIALAMRKNDFAASMNGGAVVTDTSGNLPLNATKLTIGSAGWAVSNIPDTANARITYYPTRLDNTTLVKLSQI